MKWLIFPIAFLFMSINSFAQGHFKLAFEGNGEEQMNINVISAMNNGALLKAGDEIAIFDENICCGKIILSEPIVLTNSNSHVIICATKSFATPTNGYTLGHTILYKFWDSTKSQEISGIVAQYIDPMTGSVVSTPTFHNGSATVKLSYTSPVNQAPTANAGTNQTVNQGSGVTLDGSASSDPENSALTYSWTAPAGITLSSTTAVRPTFTAPNVASDQNFTFSLVVNDGTNNSTAAQVVITVKKTNTPPIANAGPDQTVNEGILVTLNGSASTDPDNNTLSYSWTAPSGITLSSTTAERPTFTAPEVLADKTLTFLLVVNDGIVNSTADQVVITVKRGNRAPTANAGIDQSVNEGSLVTLDGSASTDPENNAITYSWTAPSGITLSSSTAMKPTFTAPEVTTDKTFTFSLIVNDGTNNSLPDQVVITVKQVNKTPIANAGPDQTVNSGALVTLNGLASSDPDQNIITYLWTAPSGISLNSATAAKPSFTAPNVLTDQNYTITLVVNDGITNSAPDHVVITVKKMNTIVTANAGVSQSVNEGTKVTLNGTASTSSDNKPLNYLWTAPAGISLTLANTATPTFTAPEVMTDQNFTFSLTVSDDNNNSSTAQVVIRVKQVNKAPTANAGANQTVNEGALVTLDGSASYDPDNDQITYLWTAPNGITLSSTTAIKPTFTAPEVMNDQSFTFSLIVNDGTINSLAQQVVIRVKQVNKAPIANAGENQTVNQGAVVTLDGSASSDPDYNVLTYSWTAPAGIILSSTTAIKPTFTAPDVPADQNFTFTLVVNDRFVNSEPSQVVVTVKKTNKAPIANAGTNQTVNQGAVVTLDGSASSDPDNNTLTYSWSAPAGITLNSTTAIKPTFTAPDVPADQNFTFTLVVNDGTINSIVSQVTVTVKKTNKPPVANAGPDQSVNQGVIVTLDGSNSYDPDNNPLTYLWTAPAEITLSSTTAMKPTFTAPDVLTNQEYTFTLTVNDGTINSSTDEIKVIVKHVNRAPTAYAGANQTVNEGALVTLDGSASYDPDNDQLTYLWTAPDGIVLSSTTAIRPTFIAPEVMNDNNFTFSLTVNDGFISSIAKQVVIRVKQVNKAPTANAGYDQTVNEGTVVTLDGTASTDPDNNTLSYLWTAPSGITLSSTTVARPTFTAPTISSSLQSFTFALTVNDGSLNSTPNQVVITVKKGNRVPVLISAKTFSATKDVFQEFLLTCTDAENDPLSFTIDNLPSYLKLTKKTNQSASLSGTFGDKQIGSNIFKLKISDGSTTITETITIVVANTDMPPYLKEPIKDISVFKGDYTQIINLNTIFADDDIGDRLSFSITMNTNNKIASPIIEENKLYLSFSNDYNGTTQIQVTATSNGKTVHSKFTVEVKIPTSAELLDENNYTSVFPNPTTGHVSIKLGKKLEKEEAIYVFTGTGKLVSNATATDDEVKLDLTGFAPGFYFVQIGSNKLNTFKIVVQ